MNVIKSLKSRQGVKLPKPRNPVIAALKNKAGGGAGAHRKSRGALRRAQRMAVAKELDTG